MTAIPASGRIASVRVAAIARVRELAPRLATESAICFALLTIAIVFNLYYLWPQVGVDVPKLNDEVLHVLSVRNFADAIQAGHDPTDL